jgi:hypothetical protein
LKILIIFLDEWLIHKLLQMVILSTACSPHADEIFYVSGDQAVPGACKNGQGGIL